MIAPPLLGADPGSPFPPAEWALDEPDGLVCIGGDLSPQRLVNAYSTGLFPWFSAGQPILWWSPSQRLVFESGGVHLSRRFRRTLRNLGWQVRFNTAFEAVISACATAPRPGQQGTWITGAMREAYVRLHALGHAHSVEVWDGERLVGGLYGVSVGVAFHAESMVSLESGGSKVALAALGRHLLARGWPRFDAQVENPHLRFMGGQVWSRARFLAAFRPLTTPRTPCPDWAGPSFAACELADTTTAP